jgi:hypothetical protein
MSVFGLVSGIEATGVPVATYFYRLKEDDFVAEFCVANSHDPDQWVGTLAPDGSLQQWAKRDENGLVVFRPPDGYTGSQGMEWHYDKRMQVHEAAPRELMEKLALNNRVSVNF